MEERHRETGGKPAESINDHLSYLFVRHYCLLLIHYYKCICLWATALSFRRKQTHQIYTALETDHSSRFIPGKQWELMLTTETLSAVMNEILIHKRNPDSWNSLFIYLTSVSVSDQPADNNKENNLTKSHPAHISQDYILHKENECVQSNRKLYNHIYVFGRRFYPKWLALHYKVYTFISICFLGSNPWPFAQLAQFTELYMSTYSITSDVTVYELYVFIRDLHTMCGFDLVRLKRLFNCSEISRSCDKYTSLSALDFIFHLS